MANPYDDFKKSFSNFRPILDVINAHTSSSCTLILDETSHNIRHVVNLQDGVAHLDDQLYDIRQRSLAQRDYYLRHIEELEKHVNS
ncbi:hypothetical protein PanWU01x14_217560, partial [Parasponia andersonii]